MDSNLQIRLSKEEYSKIEQDLMEESIKFKFCNKHQRYEKNFRSERGHKICQDKVKELLK